MGTENSSHINKWDAHEINVAKIFANIFWIKASSRKWKSRDENSERIDEYSMIPHATVVAHFKNIIFVWVRMLDFRGDR